MTKFPYVLRCAGCNARRAFMSGDAVAKWVQGHKCWLEQPTALAKYVASFSAPISQGVSNG